LNKNLARFGVADEVTLINGRSFDEATISEVRQTMGSGEVGLFIFDADNNVWRDLDCYSEARRLRRTRNSHSAQQDRPVVSSGPQNGSYHFVVNFCAARNDRSAGRNVAEASRAIIAPPFKSTVRTSSPGSDAKSNNSVSVPLPTT
jgi:hypothetical protein